MCVILQRIHGWSLSSPPPKRHKASAPASSPAGCSHSGFHVHPLAPPPLWPVLPDVLLGVIAGFLRVTDVAKLMRASRRCHYALSKELRLQLCWSYVGKHDSAFPRGSLARHVTHLDVQIGPLSSFGVNDIALRMPWVTHLRVCWGNWRVGGEVWSQPVETMLQWPAAMKNLYMEWPLGMDDTCVGTITRALASLKLAHAPQLRHLMLKVGSVKHGQVVDLSALRGASQLEDLALWFDHEIDVPSLVSLPALRCVHFNGYPVWRAASLPPQAPRYRGPRCGMWMRRRC
jgi:hypothetical protein